VSLVLHRDGLAKAIGTVSRLLLLMVFVAAVGAGGFIAFSNDPAYTLHEWLFAWRFHRYDALIKQISRKHGVDPMLIKAMIWQESRFSPKKIGGSSERGLMQVTTAAATDWVAANKIETFHPADLFDPKTNIDAGTWYMKRALDRWADKESPIPFALAEYNAGRSRVHRWIDDTQRGDKASGEDLQASISYPGTQKYIEAILRRYNFYKDRGEM
jgi:soluble lytic murein transglycosylase